MNDKSLLARGISRMKNLVGLDEERPP